MLDYRRHRIHTRHAMPKWEHRRWQNRVRRFISKMLGR